MATNPFFNFFNNRNEQRLYEDLVVEAVRIYAHDMLYLPRTGINKDDILNEYTYSEFNKAVPVELYVKNFDSFEGEGQLMAKFGLEIRDQMTLVMTIRSWNEFVGPISNTTRPQEGDCIFIPMLNVVYVVKFVNSSANFYTLGKISVHEIVCELFEYSNEKFNTGYPDIDNKYTQFQNANDVDYNLEEYDAGADNAVLQTEADTMLDFTEINPFGEGDV